MANSKSFSRLYYIDALRVLAVLLLVPYHVARIFDVWEPFYAKNAEVSQAISAFIALVGPWHMPLLFVLAGASTWLALRHRSGGEYAGERFKRLMIPFFFALVALIPPQSYYAMLTQGNDPGSYLQFYPTFFVIHPEDLSGYFGTFTPGHMWFVLFLFIFSLVALPLFLALRGERGARRTARLAAFFQNRGAIFLLAIPLAFTELLPDLGGKNPFFYILLFISGYVLMADARFSQTVDRHKKAALLLGLATMAGVVGVWLSGTRMIDFSPESIAFAFVRHFNTWFWVIALLGYGRKVLNAETSLLRYASEIAYPFYILHQTVIVVIGFYVVQWQASVAVKFAVINVAALVMTILLCEVVKRSNLTRFLFGMKSMKKARAPQALGQPAGG